MIPFLVLTFLLFVNIRAEYPGKTTSTYGTKPGNFTLLPKNSTRNLCCPCNKVTKKPVIHVSPKVMIFDESPLFRLPDSVWPILYKFSIQIDFNAFKKTLKGRAFGNLSMHVSVKNRTDVIYLHYGENLIISNISVRNINGNIVEKNLTKNFTFSVYSILQINLISNLTVGSEYLIEINNFESVYSDNQDTGIITRKYQNTQGEFENMLATQFQPDAARMVFPCFDEPRFKSKFQLNITTNSEYSILNNMPEIDCKESIDFNNSSWKTCIFETTPVMPAYNLVFAIVNFSHIEKTDKKGRKFRIWARKSEIHKTQFALDTTIEAFHLLENILKIDFPLNKIDSLAIPNLKGFLGMEHYGLITYDEPVIVWSEKFPLSFSKYLCVSIISHEVAHQWFGNLVTTAWWQEIWLNEGFATFYSHKIAKLILKDNLYFPLEIISIFNYVRNFDDHYSFIKSSISAPVSSYVEAKFDYLSYKKGFIIVNMFENMLGSKSFDLSMIDYLNKNQYQSIDPVNLYRSLNKLSNISVSDMIDGWLNKICYPIVGVNVLHNTSISINQNVSLKLKVSRFKTRSNESSTTWKIPLYIMFGNNSFQRREEIRKFENQSDILRLDNFNISDHWLILNVNYGSFFTTDYDDVIFTRLRNQFLSNHLVIPPLSRAQIMQDFYDISKKFQRSNLADLLKLFIYLRNETDPVPMITGLNLIDKLNGLLQFRSFYPTWVKYVTKILQPTLDKLVIDFQNDFRDSNSLYFTLRRLILNLACKLKLEQCSKITNKIIERWNSDKLLNSDYDLLQVALCKYIEIDSNGENWQSVYGSNKFQSWDYINVKYYALGCSKVPWVIDKNIDIASNTLRSRNDRVLFPHVSALITDHMPPDYLHGTTSLSNILILSMIYNTPNSMHFLNRFTINGLNNIYHFLQYPPHFPTPHSIVEYAVPTLSHYNFIIYVFHQKDETKDVILIEAKANIEWILKNKDFEKQLQRIMM